MITNYFKTAFRYMLRQRGYAVINIAGLSMGIAATLLIVIYLADELSFDRFHADYENIYRGGFGGKLQGNHFQMALTPAPLAGGLLSEVPGVTDAVRFGLWRTMPMSYKDKALTEKHFLIADSNFFEFFTFPVLKGDARNFLKGPDKLVITESAARKYFGDEDPIGKIMLRGSEKAATEVVGVVNDPPQNSHITFDMVLSADSWDYMKNTQWTSNNLYTYFKLTPGADVEDVQAQVDIVAGKHIEEELEKYLGVSFAQFREQGNGVGIFLQPMREIHLKSSLQEEITPNGNIQYLYIFGAVAVFIILIACINFMNLSTARSANRAKEVGVRKTIGANRGRLVFQFLSESLLYSAVSMLLALGIIGLTLDGFNFLSGKQLDFSLFTRPDVVAGIALFTIAIGLISGSYPAFYLTAYKPAEVLKGKIRAGFRNTALRNVLVVLQFTISVALIFGSMVVYRQLQYIQDKNLGFDKENVVNLLHTRALGKNAQPFKHALAADPSFRGASFSNNLPPNITWSNAFRKGGSEQDFLLFVYQMDYDHLETMGYEMAAGRFFSKDFPSDSSAIILNETAYRQMGYTNLDEAEVLSYQSEQPTPMKVIGVLKDIHFRSLKDDLTPMAILLSREPNFEMAIRLAPGNTRAQIETLENLWKQYAPGTPFEYSFLDQNFDMQFRAEQRMGQIILVFTVLAIGIACLGLFGLSAYTAEQRGREISIRKVMGASTRQVMILLTRDFTMLVLIAIAIATPLAWYLTEHWLQGFSTRIQIGIALPVVSGLIGVAIALFTISFQSVRAARENPVNAMRSE